MNRLSLQLKAQKKKLRQTQVSFLFYFLFVSPFLFLFIFFPLPSSQFGKDNIVTWIVMRFISAALIDSKIQIEFVENDDHVIYVVAHYSACDKKHRKKHGITFVCCPHIQCKQTIHLYKTDFVTTSQFGNQYEVRHYNSSDCHSRYLDDLRFQ